MEIIINKDSLNQIENLKKIIDEQNNADSNGNHVTTDEIINEAILIFYLQTKNLKV